MTTDYGKKKNAELEELLKARSLPHTGKKAELIARLLQSDKDAAATTTTSKPTTAATDGPAEDEIDWDDDAVAPQATTSKTASTDISAKAATTPAAAAAIAAGGQGQSANPAAVPNQIPTDEPFKTDDITVKAPGQAPSDDGVAPTPGQKDATAEATTKPTTKESEPAKPPTDYTANIPSTTLEEEIEKRKKRAARFGISTTGAENDTAKAAAEEAVKALERAKKFGIADGSKPAVKGLDEALPERSKKRGRGGEEDGGRGSKRAKGGRRNGDERRSRSKSKGAERKKTEGKGAEAKTAAATNGDAKAAQKEKDRLAAEARKKRFGM
ncbi:MAG: hypothetical protein Q9181_005400 [Wetmoreana brouardii]